MRIVHVAPSAPYNDYWGYQDNLLPKYHKKLGHEVSIIVTNLYHKDGKIEEGPCDDYVLNDGVRVIRLRKKDYGNSTLTHLWSHLEVYDILCELKPDFIFYHGMQSKSVFDIIRYKKKQNPKCVIVQDNHLDYNIGRRCKTFKDYVIRAIYRRMNKKSIPYIEKVYGVTPWRKLYAEDFYKISPDKTDVLIMGADDEKIDFGRREELRNEIRTRYGVKETDFLVITGGKIDTKKKIHLLMQAAGNMPGLKLWVFGNVSEDLKAEFDALLQKYQNIHYLGWIAADSVYEYFFASDIAFFPGQHSVLWEQACASKIPCVFEKWEGMEHVNNGGNSDFVENVTVDTLKQKLEELLFTDAYYRMKEVALSPATDIYLYSRIAIKSLESVQNENS